MTTVYDPAGTPAVYYNKSGIAAYAMAGGVSSPVAITRYSEVTIVSVTDLTLSGDTQVELPTGADVGDVVELYAAWNSNGTRSGIGVTAPSGETLSGRVGLGESGQVIYCRKIAPTDWWATPVTGSW